MSHITRRRDAKELREHLESFGCYPWEIDRQKATAVTKPRAQMEYSVVCWKCGTELKAGKSRKYSAKGKSTVIAVRPCPKCVKDAGMDVVKWMHCVKK